MWTSLASPLLCSRPRAGHSMMLLGSAILRDTGTHGQGENVKLQCALLVFGGSDCSGSFYDDTIKCTVEIPFDKWVQIGQFLATMARDVIWHEKSVLSGRLILLLCVLLHWLCIYVSSVWFFYFIVWIFENHHQAMCCKLRREVFHFA